MSDRTPDPLQGLPEDLARLDEELRGLHISERPSFGPELKAECERAWIEGVADEAVSRPVITARRVVAAASLALLFVSLSVPPARAALAELSRSALVTVGVLEEAETEAPFTVESTVPAAPSLEETTLDAVTLPPPEPVAALRPAVADDEEGVEAAPEATRETPAFTGISATFPELMDRRAEQLAVRRHYPPELLDRGIGGTVRLQLWVDADGRVDNVEVRGSGYPQLDRAARRAVRDLRFVPATRGGEPVGAWVEFDMVFEPRLAEDAPAADVPEAALAGEPVEPIDPESWSTESVVATPVGTEARELLGRALGVSEEHEFLGSLDGLLRGVPPAGVSPLGWRSEAVVVLEQAIREQPSNPAPYLALGRILRKQGLTADAARTFANGVARAGLAHSGLRAELQYERGMLSKASWQASAALGRLDLRAEDTPRCARVETPADPTAPEALIALNFLCPDELERVMESSFRAMDASADLRGDMITAFEAAATADPGHPGAHRELLLDLASEGRWLDVLARSRSFASASYGHPHAYLLSGLALQRLGRSEEAMAEFETAFRGLPAGQRQAMTSIRPLLTADEAAEMDDLGVDERRAAVRAFWNRLDPIRSTRVNEREVEHLARAAWAILRFGGVDTDPGDVWVRYGAPQRIRAVGADTDLLAEFWDYGGAPYVTFRRPAMSTQLELSAEARAYLEDLRHVFPHRYGSDARTVEPLSAVLSRFRSPRGGTDLEIRTALPEGLDARQRRELSLTVFTLDADGTLLSALPVDIDDAEPDLAFQAYAGPGAASVVVELWDPRRGAASALRSSLPRGVDEELDADISDLLLLRDVRAPGTDVTRDASWLEPLPTGEVTADRVAALVELYDVPAGTFRLRVEAVPVDGGEALPVPHRPAGEIHFVTGWTRSVDRDTPVHTEYLTLDLGSVPTGDYTVRVSVERPGDADGAAVTTGTLYRVRGGGGR